MLRKDSPLNKDVRLRMCLVIMFSFGLTRINYVMVNLVIMLTLQIKICFIESIFCLIKNGYLQRAGIQRS